jgi:polysaccharide export outer membrane protein
MRKQFWIAVVAAGLMSSFGWAQKKDSSAVDAAMKAQAADPNYVIGPEDMLAVNVWKEAEVSGPVPVRPDGKISLPLLNDVQAAGLTPMQLAANISEGLKKFISEPRVTVTVTGINSRRVFMVGQLKAGAFPLLPNMTVLQALSAAGCCSEFANTKKIYVLRNENGKQMKYPFNFKEALKGEHPEKNIVLQPGDTIVVP